MENKIINIGTYNKREIFSKYITVAALFNGRGDCITASNLVQSMNFDFTSDPGELRAGARNPIQILLPTNANAKFALTFATAELEHIEFATGAKSGFGGVIPQNAGLALSAGGTFSLPAAAKPVRELGAAYDKPIARIDGYAYEIMGSAGAYTVSMPTGVSDKKYCVTWFEFAPEAKLLKVSTDIAGKVARVVAIVPLFARPQSGDVSASPEIGFRMFTFPSAQADGSVSVPASQDNPATITINFNALPFTETPDSDSPCIGVEQYFGYIQDYLYEDSGYAGVTEIYVPGSLVTAEEGQTTQIPLMMRRGAGAPQPVIDVDDFDWTLIPPSLGTISTTGGVAAMTGGTAGTGILKIAGKALGAADLTRLTANAAVEVEA